MLFMFYVKVYKSLGTRREWICQKTDILYMRETKKLFNKNTQPEGVKVEKPVQKQRQGKDIKHVKCPYFRNSPNNICVRMTEKGLDARLSDFDIQHFCNGNPINCFFFRLPPPKKEDETKRFLRKHRFFNIRRKPMKTRE